MRFQCPYCKEILSVDNAEMGAKVQCGKCQQIVTVPASRTSPGAVIADFIIEKELGRGGMGVVYHGHDPLLNRPVAIKILSQALTGNPEAKERFLRFPKRTDAIRRAHSQRG